MNMEEDYNNYELSYELNKFDIEFIFWPVQIADFVTRMGEITPPLHKLPIIGLNKANRVVQLSDEETVLIYQRINSVFKKFEPLNDKLKNSILEYFDIVFIPDATQQDVDVLCLEAFGNLDTAFEDYNPVVQFTQDHPDLQSPVVNTTQSTTKKRSQRSRRANNYNTPIIRTSCSNCEENTLRLKLLKKIQNAKMHDLLKVESCIRGIRVENTLMASLPPINEIDHKLHENLINVMEKRVQAESQYLDVTLPRAIDNIKLDWYQHMHQQQNPDLTVYVPETDYDEV